MPTARHSTNLRRAIALSAELDCQLVALCSRQASARAAVARARPSGIRGAAIDADRLPPSLMPAFETSSLLDGTPFQRRQDTSLKRNLGLLLAAAAGWQRIVFLDDDIEVPRVDDLLDAASLLDGHAAVGLSVGGFPDNSVVCHAYRDAGGMQDTFIGGGALAVDATSRGAFFPSIYNEDWFFLLDSSRLRSATRIGHAIQQPYDPYADEQRARSEELGDFLAEGIFWLLDRGRRVKDADVNFWRTFLDKRRRFIKDVIAMVSAADFSPGQRIRMVSALKAAIGRSHLIYPRLCVDYLQAWRTDCRRWRRHVDQYWSSEPIQLPKVLSELGLMECSEYF